jgi:hypothetical protein
MSICFSFKKKSNFDKILAVRMEGLFQTWNKVRCPSSFGLWAQPLEAFTLCLANSYILLAIIVNSFLRTLNKVWPFNPMAIP